MFWDEVREDGCIGECDLDGWNGEQRAPTEPPYIPLATGHERKKSTMVTTADTVVAMLLCFGAVTVAAGFYL